MFDFFKKSKAQNFAQDGNFKRDKSMIAEYHTALQDQAVPGKNDSKEPVMDDSQSQTENKINRWKAQQTLKTNLIQDESAIYIDKKKNIEFLAIYVLSAFFILTLIYGGLLMWEMSAKERLDSLSTEITDVQSEIRGLEDQLTSAEELEKKIKIGGELLSKHIYWTNFFKFLEENTLTGVYYSENFSGDISGVYSLKATADSYRAISDQVKVLKKNEFVEDARVVSGVIAEKSKDAAGLQGSIPISFQLELALDPAIFNKYKNADIK